MQICESVVGEHTMEKTKKKSPTLGVHTIYNNQVSADSLEERFHSLFRRGVYAKRWKKLTEHWMCYGSVERKLCL